MAGISFFASDSSKALSRPENALGGEIGAAFNSALFPAGTDGSSFFKEEGGFEGGD